MQRPPLPPFNDVTALAKVKAAEDAWNSRDPAKVAQAYTPESIWRNRDEFLQGRKAIEDFLTRKWSHELHYRLMKELWAYTDNRISVRFEYEWQHAKTGQWFRMSCSLKRSQRTLNINNTSAREGTGHAKTPSPAFQRRNGISEG